MPGNQPLSVIGNGPIRVAIIGAGYVSPYHLRGWQRHQNIEIVALCDIDHAQAEAISRQFGISKVYVRFEEMLDTEKPDVVDICTPAATHPLQVRAAAVRGIHVLCQKPLADGLEAARELATITESAGVRLMVHENFRFRIWYRELKRQLDSGIIGRPYYCRSDARIGGTVTTALSPDRPWILKHHPHYAEVKNYLILESMIHQLDVCRYLFGDAHRIYARARRISPFIKGEDIATLIVDFDNMHAVVERNYAARGHLPPPIVTEKVVVEGEKGSIFIDPNGSMRVEVDIPGDRQTIAPEYGIQNAYPESFAATIQHFVECLRSGTPFETGPEDNLKTLALTFAAYESLKTGQAIPLIREIEES
jgi:D-apiose dehydrogenase